MVVCAGVSLYCMVIEYLGILWPQEIQRSYKEAMQKSTAAAQEKEQAMAEAGGRMGCFDLFTFAGMMP